MNFQEEVIIFLNFFKNRIESIEWRKLLGFILQAILKDKNLTPNGKTNFRNQIYKFIDINTLDYYGNLSLTDKLILNNDKEMIISWFKIINSNYNIENTLKLKFHMMFILIPIIESNEKSLQLNKFFKCYNINYTSNFLTSIYNKNFPKEDIRNIIIVLKNF